MKTSASLWFTVIWIYASSLCGVDGFGVNSRVDRQGSLGSAARSYRPMILRATADESEEDDGWDDDTATTEKYSKKASQLQELKALRLQSASAPEPLSAESTEPERDLFIPIFALVSLAGLFGAYGYEMLRLYSRGELYLPF